jgi:hypothetical protein
MNSVTGGGKFDVILAEIREFMATTWCTEPILKLVVEPAFEAGEGFMESVIKRFAEVKAATPVVCAPRAELVLSSIMYNKSQIEIDAHVEKIVEFAQSLNRDARARASVKQERNELVETIANGTMFWGTDLNEFYTNIEMLWEILYSIKYEIRG